MRAGERSNIIQLRGGKTGRSTRGARVIDRNLRSAPEKISQELRSGLLLAPLLIPKVLPFAVHFAQQSATFDAVDRGTIIARVLNAVYGKMTAMQSQRCNKK